MIKFFMYFLTCCLALGPCLCFAQNAEIDSLIRLVKRDIEDSNKINHLNDLCSLLAYVNADTAIIVGNQSLQLAEKLKWKKEVTNSYGLLGTCNWIKGDYDRAIDYQFKAFKLDQIDNNKIGIARRLGNIGIVYHDQGDFPKALEFYLKALKINEELGRNDGIAINIGNIGLVYRGLGDYTKALEYYFKALKMDQVDKDKINIATDFGNIGAIYQDKGDFPKALQYYLEAIKMAEETGDKDGIAFLLGNIGIIYEEQALSLSPDNKSYKAQLNKKALDCFLKSIKIKEEIGNKNGIAVGLASIGRLYLITGKFKEAETYLKKAVDLNSVIGVQDNLRGNEEELSRLYELTGKFKLALEHYKKAIVLKDSIFSQENKKQIVRKEMNFEFEKKQAADSIKNVEQAKQEELKHDQEIKQQKIYTYGGVIGFVLMLIVAGVSFRAYRQKQKANEIIALQKELVEEKQKEILDSIRYAKRIQQSLLPTEKYVHKNISRLNKN